MFNAIKTAKEFLAKKAAECKAAVVACCAAVASAIMSAPSDVMAALAPADEALILSGLTTSDATFYKIGGAVLVVLAGIWGFRKVMGLIGR